MTTILQSTLTCPACGTQATETMPTDACLYFYTCAGCDIRLKPKHGDCCVFCSYGSVPCPPIQEGAGSACCSEVPESASPDCCSLAPAPFRERMAEIAALIRDFGGHTQHTPGGVELRFGAAEGLRAALDSLAEKERACCATLSVAVVEQAGSISLRIEGQGDDRTAIDDLTARLGAARKALTEAGASLCARVEPTAELRANMHRPDWSKVTLPRAREVLLRRIGADPAGVARWEGLGAGEDKTLAAVLRYFADHGRSPSAKDVASASGQSLDQARRSLEALLGRDLVVLDQSCTSILAAYPFTTYPTGHRVTLRGQPVDSLCAIDALGAGAMCRTDASITSACAHCAAPLHVATSRNGTELGVVEPAGAVVWYTLTFDGCAAQSCCPSTVFFCNDDHLAAWRAGKGAHTTGDRLSIAEALEIGIALFEPLLRPVA